MSNYDRLDGLPKYVWADGLSKYVRLDGLSNYVWAAGLFKYVFERIVCISCLLGLFDLVQSVWVDDLSK